MSLRTPTFLCDAPFSYDANTVENFFPYEATIPNWADERQYPDFECKDDEAIKYEYFSSDDLFSTKTEMLPDNIHATAETPRIAQMLPPLQDANCDIKATKTNPSTLDERFESFEYLNGTSNASYTLFDHDTTSQLTCIMAQSPLVVVPFQQYVYSHSYTDYNCNNCGSSQNYCQHNETQPIEPIAPNSFVKQEYIQSR
uniref:Uncharacterized protein n=1 Tax=Parascaris univalens TaxID=6257 RepID=A0A914ZDI8_PARUN